jgi:hypothetical protein
MGTSKRASSAVWCILLAGLLLAAAEVEAGRAQKQGKVGGPASGSTDNVMRLREARNQVECIYQYCNSRYMSWDIKYLQCVSDCERSFPEARSVGAKSGIVADPASKANAIAAGSTNIKMGLREARNQVECIYQYCNSRYVSWDIRYLQCVSDCERAFPEAGSVGTRGGVVADAASECFTHNCQWRHGADRMQCMFDCGAAKSSAAGSTDMALGKEGTGAGADRAILRVV